MREASSEEGRGPGAGHERLDGPGGPGGAGDLRTVVYGELHRIASGMMRGQARDHTLQPTALVHEAYVKLAGRTAEFSDRQHYFAVAAKAMRQVLTDHARAQRAAKREGPGQRITLSGCDVSGERSEVDLIALDEALDRLREQSPRYADIAELRFLTGRTVEEVADVLELSERTVKTGWRAARAFLRDALESA